MEGSVNRLKEASHKGLISQLKEGLVDQSKEGSTEGRKIQPIEGRKDRLRDGWINEKKCVDR